MMIPDKYLDQLRAADLRVSQVFDDEHPFMPSCVRIVKPAHVQGNSLPDRSTDCGGGMVTDAPTLSFFHKDGRWYVNCHEYRPGPGPGDFHNEWETPEEAVSDILAFFFGDPSRVNAKSREARMKSAQRDIPQR